MGTPPACGTPSPTTPRCCSSSCATPDGVQPDDYFITTETDADPAEIAGHYAGRSSIEVTYRDAKQHLDAQDPQGWRRKGPERVAALALWLHAAV